MNLKIDWASHEAAKHACINWHYSKCMPAGKLVKYGVWFDGVFQGVIIFSRGATPNLGSPYGMRFTEVAELTRIALRGGHPFPVSRALGVAIKLLKQYCLGLRMLVSYADMDQGHNGGIYQATNWFYAGPCNAGVRSAFIINGKKTHPRSIGAMGGIQSLGWIRKNLDHNASEFITKGKHKYLWFYDKELERKFEHLRFPYIKRAVSKDNVAASDQEVGGGAIPTTALQNDAGTPQSGAA